MATSSNATQGYRLIRMTQAPDQDVDAVLALLEECHP